MAHKKLTSLILAVLISVAATFSVMAETATTTMENSGAFLFEWRPVDCGDGHSFAILVGGNTINESNVILNREDMTTHIHLIQWHTQGHGDRFRI